MAAFILSLVVVGLVNVFVSGKKWIAHSRYRITAAELVRSSLDALQIQVKQSAWTGNCLGAGTGCPDNDDSEVVGAVSYSPTYTVTSTNNLKKVKLQISWTEP